MSLEQSSTLFYFASKISQITLRIVHKKRLISESFWGREEKIVFAKNNPHMQGA